jgi:hypothetical protein
MSTEHSTEHDPDLEYDATPPGAKYEHTDIDPAVGYKFALWLAASMVVSFAIVYGAFWFFERRAARANEAAQQYPLAADFERPRPTPALQTQPFADVYTLRQGEADRLTTYGWVDKDGGVARIPIDRAMEALLQRGLSVRPDAVNARDVVTQDSSSGRTTVPR